MKKSRISMAMENVLGALLPLIIVVAVVSISFSALTNRLIRDSVTQKAAEATNQVAGAIEQELIPIKVKIDDFVLIAKSQDKRDDLNNAIFGISEDMKYCTSFYYATKEDCFSGLENGFYLDSSGWTPDEGWIPQQRDWYKDAVAANGSLVISEPYVDSMTHELCVTFSRAVLKDGELIGVNSGDLILNDLVGLTENVHASENDTINIVTDTGLYLTNSDPSKVMTKSYLEEAELFKNGFSGRDFLNGEAKQFISNNRYYAVKKLDGLPWFAVIEGPVSDFSGYYQSRTLTIYVIIIVLALISSIFIFIFTRKTTSAFRKLAASCSRLAEGDFTEKFTDYHTNEANDLSHGFEDFSNGVKNLVKKVSAASNVVSNSSESLSDTAGSISRSVTSTENSIAEMNGAVQNQISAMNDVYQNVNSVISKVNQLADEVKGQNNLIISSSSDIEGMMEKFLSITKDMENVSDKVEQLVSLSLDNKKELEDSVKLIQVVQAESGSLLEMNKVISSVASETNLLAMNAAIEAAHAGKVGAGFSVVSEEIRKLAETTAKQAKDSTASLKSIQNKINDITDSSMKVEKSFGDIIGKIENVSGIVSELAGSVSEQGKKANGVLSSLSNMKNSSEKAASNADRIIESTKDSLDSCSQMKDRSVEVEEHIKSCSDNIMLLKNAGSLVVENSTETQKSVAELTEAIGMFKID